MYDHWRPSTVNAMRRNAIAHFFEHYKSAERASWVPGDWLGGIGPAKEGSHGQRAANYSKSQAWI